MKQVATMELRQAALLEYPEFGDTLPRHHIGRAVLILLALASGVVITITLTHLAPAIAPYSFGITILLDMCLAMYGYIRNY